MSEKNDIYFFNSNDNSFEILNLFDTYWTKNYKSNTFSISFIKNNEEFVKKFQIIDLLKLYNLKKDDEIKIFVSDNLNFKKIKLIKGDEIFYPKYNKNNAIYFSINNNFKDIEIYEGDYNVTNEIKYIITQKYNKIDTIEKKLIEKKFETKNYFCRLIISKNNNYDFNYYGILKPYTKLNFKINKNLLNDSNFDTKFSNLNIKQKNFIHTSLKNLDDSICN